MITIQSFQKPEHFTGTQSSEDDSSLFVRTWKGAINRLIREETSLLEAIKSQNNETRHKSQLRLISIRYEIEIFEMCIDHIHEQQEAQHGDNVPEREAERRRFYRLMVSVAKAKIDQKDHAQRTSLVGDASESEVWSENRWVVELQQAASQSCHRMARM